MSAADKRAGPFTCRSGKNDRQNWGTNETEMQSGDLSVVQRRAMHTRPFRRSRIQRPRRSSSTPCVAIKPRRDINPLGGRHLTRTGIPHRLHFRFAAEIVARSPAGAGALITLRLLRNNGSPPPHPPPRVCVCVCVSLPSCVSRAIVR